MTPEEHDRQRLQEGTVEYRAMRVLYPFSNPQGVERQILEQDIAQAIREAKAEAYEEAARTVDAVRELNGSNWNEEALRTLDVAVVRVQRLKDSLLPETVSSS